MKQHEVLGKLNMQAHQNTAANSDEFVMGNLITYDKMACLVHELLAAEAWAAVLFPLVKGRLSGRNSLHTYFIVRTVVCLSDPCQGFHVCPCGCKQMYQEPTCLRS